LFSHTRSEENSQAGTTEAVTVFMGFLSDLEWLSGTQGQERSAPCLLQPGQLIVDNKPIAYSLFPGVVTVGQQPVFPQLVAAQSIKDWSSLPKTRAINSGLVATFPPQEAHISFSSVLIKVF